MRDCPRCGRLAGPYGECDPDTHGVHDYDDGGSYDEAFGPVGPRREQR